MNAVERLADSQGDRDRLVTVADGHGGRVRLRKPPHVFTRNHNGSGMHWFIRPDNLYGADAHMHPRGLAWLREHYAEFYVMGLDAHLYESLEKS